MKRKKPQIDPARKYGVKEICDILDICRSTIYNHTRKEEIAPVRVSTREIYYLGTEVDILYNIITSKRNKPC